MLRYIDGKPKAVTFSYDDGCRQDIILSQLLYKYKLKGTFNLNSDWFGKNVNDQHLTKEEIKNYIISNGHEIAVHGAQHLANGNVRSVNGIYDVLKCRLDLEREFDCIVRGMAYPDTGISLFQNNASFKKIRNYLIDLDIVYARSFNTKGGNFELPDDWHNLIPTAHHRFLGRESQFVVGILLHRTGDKGWFRLLLNLLLFHFGNHIGAFS